VKNRLVVFALLASACMAMVSGCGDGGTQSSAPRFAVFVASDEKSAQYFTPRKTPDGRSIYTSDEPLLTESEVARSHVGEFADGLPMLIVDLTEVGIRTLTDRAEEYVDQELAILWNDQVVSVPRIKHPLSNQIAIVSSEWLPAQELVTIAEYLNNRQSAAAEGR
jgi:preprotein translocase subunit SecD